MPVTGWIRKRNALHAAEDHAGRLVRAAARGDSLDNILGLGARVLLAAGVGDRAGLWLAGNRRGEVDRGEVIEAKQGPIPEQWKRIDISTPFLRAALESSEPLRVESGMEMMPNIGPLMGMQSAIWIPLRARNYTMGLAMVAHAHGAVEVDIEMLRARADEIALSISHYRDTRSNELAAEERRAQVRLSRAILCGVSVDSILPQIARAARHYAQAEFIALGRASESPVQAEAWDGPEEWRSILTREPLERIWCKVQREGQEMELSGESIRIRMGASSDQCIPDLDRVIAIPIEAQNRSNGVLMAGLLASENSNEDSARLEPYALLAALALDREVERHIRAEWTQSLQQIVEESRECLIGVDEKGFVREVRQAASAFLFPLRRVTNELPLECFFAPVAREAVFNWRSRFTRLDAAAGSEAKYEQPFLEAALTGGTVIRLHLRSAVHGFENGKRMWLIGFEDQSSGQALLAAEGRLETEMAGIMDSIDSGVLLLDAAGKIRFASDRLAAIMGVEARRLSELGTIEALIDSVAWRFHRPSETAAQWREHVRHGDEATWNEFELVRPTRKIVERFAKPLFQADGARLGWLEVYRDITGQRSIQSKLLQTEKMAALGQLVSGIAHELNNPLTSIQGYAQLLLSRRTSTQRMADARRISQEAERAGRIVKNLLLFSREAKSERRAVNLNEVIERTLALRSYELRLEGISVDLSLDKGLPRALADSAQLQQVILNLIVNAEQAITQGRVPGSSPGHIVIRTKRLAGDRIGMEVSDDGSGILPEVVSRIFDPFFTTKPAGVGTGLGLSIVYGIVREHGGEVSVESQPGRGATLTVELPSLAGAALDFTGEDTSMAMHGAAVVSLPHSPSFTSTSVFSAASPGRILIVEDEPTVAQLIADVMAEEGHPVDTLLDSREALNLIEERNYDLVICDLKMPHMDGPSLYRALVRTGSVLQHRFLFVTGDTMSPRTLDFLKASGLPYLAKPFLVEELKEAVRMAVSGTPSDEEVAAGPELPRSAAREK